MEFRSDINGLRAIAVLAVVLYHFQVAGFTGGFVGVDVFFVISGYLMTRIISNGHESNSFSLFGFYLSRARRIIPALAVVCAALEVVGFFHLSPVDYKELSRQIAAAMTFVSNFLFWNEAGYFDSAAKEKWLLHTWSLSVEWQFYLLYPIYILFVERFLTRRSGLALALWIAFGFSFASSIGGTSLRPLAAFYLLPTRAWEMFAGGLVFIYSGHFNKFSHPKRRILEAAGLALIGVAVALFDERTDWPGYLAAVPVIGTAFVLLAFVPRSIVTSNVVAQFLGRTSYSTYLWHWPIVVLFRVNDIPSTVVALAGGVALSILMGFLSFRLIEQPFGKKLQQKEVSWQIIAFAASVPIVIVAIGIVFLDGLEGRYNGSNGTKLQQFKAALDDWDYPSNCGRIDIFGRLKLCSLGGRNKETVLFIGDSQIEQWWPWFDQTQNRGAGHPIIFATYGGCPPLPHVNRFTPGFRCSKFFDAAKRLAGREDISTVVFGAAWTDYFIGAYNSKDRKPALYVVSKDGNRVPVVSGDDIFKGIFFEFSDFLGRLSASGKRVIVILPIPGRYEAISKMLYVATWQNQPLPDLTISESSFRQYSQEIVSTIRAAASAGGAEIIDPVEFLCADDICPVVSESGAPLYRDGAHLRPFAVRERAAFLDRIVR